MPTARPVLADRMHFGTNQRPGAGPRSRWNDSPCRRGQQKPAHTSRLGAEVKTGSRSPRCSRSAQPRSGNRVHGGLVIYGQAEGACPLSSWHPGLLGCVRRGRGRCPMNVHVSATEAWPLPHQDPDGAQVSRPQCQAPHNPMASGNTSKPGPKRLAGAQLHPHA